ncbi:hypothetical protein ACFVX6_15715 [Streptomyces sp. NPDC058289]|uniref:hypothetical protein n=1 Tax=Streptomyces sp. NPDC058289 TaxID=3346425 RepID=UPI0036EC18D8
MRRLTRGTVTALAMPALLIAVTAATAAPLLHLDGTVDFCLTADAARNLNSEGITMQPAGDAKSDPDRPNCVILPFTGATLATDLSGGGADLEGGIAFTRQSSDLKLTNIHIDITHATITADSSSRHASRSAVPVLAYTDGADHTSITPTGARATDVPLLLTPTGQSIFTSAFGTYPGPAPLFNASSESHLATSLPHLP